MKAFFPSFLFVLLSFLSTPLAQAGPKDIVLNAVPPKKQSILADYTIEAYSFDWDDNVFNFRADDSPVLVYKKKENSFRKISTGDYAQVRHQLGVTEEWKDYEIRNESYQFMAEAPGHNYFLESIKHALDAEDPQHLPDDVPKARESGSFKGPMWDSFVKALSRRETALRVSIITARQHDPKSLLAGLTELKRRKLIRFLPLVANLYAVNNPAFRARYHSPIEQDETEINKARVITTQLDSLEKEARQTKMKKGHHAKEKAIWTFSDDDSGNFLRARDRLAQIIKKEPKRWPDLRIQLFYTGKQTSDFSYPIVISQACEPGYCAAN